MGSDDLFHRRKAKAASDLERKQARKQPYEKAGRALSLSFAISFAQEATLNLKLQPQPNGRISAAV